MSDELGFQAHFLPPAESVQVDVEDVEQVDSKQGGTEGVQLSLDWLSLTTHPSEEAPVDVEQVQLAASLALGCEVGDWTILESGSFGYQRGMVGPGQARIWWDAPGRADIHVTLPGKACRIAGRERLVHLLRFGLSHGGKATRCDTVIDDYLHVVRPGEVLTVLQGSDVVTHAQRVVVQQGTTVGSQMLTGETVYLGAPESRQRLRVYDKGLESGGQENCIRWELESRKEAAETMALALAYGDWGQVIVSRLVGFVDFRDHDSHSEVENRTRLPWFQKLVGLARKASAYLPKPARTAHEVVDWVDRAIGPSLAVVMSVFQGDMGKWQELLDRGRDRWKPRHEQMVREVRAWA